MGGRPPPLPPRLLRLCRCQSSVTGVGVWTIFGGAQKLYSFEFEIVDQKPNVYIAKWILEWKQKKGFHRAICASFHEFWGEDQKEIKKESLLQILWKNNTCTRILSDDHYFGGLRPPTALQWHRACYFLWGSILAWRGTILVWGVQAVIWEETPRNTSETLGLL